MLQVPTLVCHTSVRISSHGRIIYRVVHKSGPFYFVAYIEYTTHLLKISITYLVYIRLHYLRLVAWHSGRTSVSDRRTFAVLRLTCG